MQAGLFGHEQGEGCECDYEQKNEQERDEGV